MWPWSVEGLLYLAFFLWGLKAVTQLNHLVTISISIDYLYLHWLSSSPFQVVSLSLYLHLYLYVYHKFCLSAPEASWSLVLDPRTSLLFDVYHYLEQNGSFWLVPEHAPGPSSQVLLVAGFDTRWIPRWISCGLCVEGALYLDACLYSYISIQKSFCLSASRVMSLWGVEGVLYLHLKLHFKTCFKLHLYPCFCTYLHLKSYLCEASRVFCILCHIFLSTFVYLRFHLYPHVNSCLRQTSRVFPNSISIPISSPFQLHTYPYIRICISNRVSGRRRGCCISWVMSLFLHLYLYVSSIYLYLYLYRYLDSCLR